MHVSRLPQSYLGFLLSIVDLGRSEYSHIKALQQMGRMGVIATKLDIMRPSIFNEAVGAVAMMVIDQEQPRFT